jgi:TfoX/Sxy family transcriptional regulator of competence genes
MSSTQDYAEYIVEQIDSAGIITFKKMFGEYAIYCDNKVVALICNNQLFIKPTEQGKYFIGDITEAAPYPKAKMYYLIDDKIDDREWLSELIRITANQLPEPKPKKRKLINK